MLIGPLVSGEPVGQASAVGAGAEEITLRLLYQLIVIRWLMKGQERRVPALGEPSAARG